MANDSTTSPVENGLLSRELKVEASFKFTSDDFPAKEIKMTTKRSIKDVTTKRILIPKQTKRYATEADVIDGSKVIALPPKTIVALLIFKLPAVPGNKGISPVLINSVKFNSNDPNNGWQKLEGDGTAALWDAYFGDPNAAGTPAIGVKPDPSGKFYFFHQNSVDVILDVTIGLIDDPNPKKEEAKEKKAADHDEDSGHSDAHHGDAHRSGSHHRGEGEGQTGA